MACSALALVLVAAAFAAFASLPAAAGSQLGGGRAHRPPSRSRAQWRVVTPEAFGAVGDGVTNDTTAVRKACSACASLGGCTLLFAGTYLTGPIALPSNDSDVVISGALHLGNRSWWGPRPSEAAFGSPSFITVAGSPRGRNVTIAGGGLINGHGAAWWAAVHDDLAFRPGMLFVQNITGFRINNVTLKDSPNHNLKVSNCDHVRVRNMSVYAPHSSKNTDGINVGGGTDTLIEQCHISNGDDCVSIITDKHTLSGGVVAGGNVVVRGLHCVGSHGISIGSIRVGAIRNVSVSDIDFYDSDNGVRIKAYPNGSGVVRGISYSNIRFHNVRNPIYITGSYCPPSQRPYPCPQGDTAISFRDISITDVYGTVNSETDAGLLNCSSLAPCRNITLRNIDIASTKGPRYPVAFQCSNAHGTARNVTPASCLA